MDGDEDISTTGEEFGREVGQQLRAVRRMRFMSLKDVEEKSGGRWTAVAVASYERADRQLKVEYLAELAGFYRVRVGDLLPPEPLAA